MNESQDADASPDIFEKFKEKLLVLKGRKQWWTARWEIEQMSRATGLTDEQKEYLRQQLALCTYKDPELRRIRALDEALDVLLPGGDLRGSVESPETTGIAGAIHKRMWEVDGREFHLQDALGWYERGADLVTRPGADFDACPLAGNTPSTRPTHRTCGPTRSHRLCRPPPLPGDHHCTHDR